MTIRQTRARAVSALLGLALVLTACAGSDGEAEPEETDDGEAAAAEAEGDEELEPSDDEAGVSDTTLRVSVISSSAAIFDELAGDFEAETGIALDVESSDVDVHQTTTRTQLTSGTAPDVIYVWPGAGNPLSVSTVHDFLADVSDEPWASEMPEGFRSLVEVDGETKAIVLTTTFIGLVRNTSVFEQFGWEAPETWSELLDLCQAIDAEGITPIALALQTPWQTQLATYALVPTTVYSGEPEWNQQRLAGEVSFADSGWADALENYLELQDSGCFNDDALGTEYDGGLQQIGSGESAMMIQIASGIQQMQEYGTDDAEFIMTPLPATDDPEATWAAAAPAVTFAINKDSEHQEEARALLQFLRDRVGDVAATVAAVPSFPGDYEDDPRFSAMVDMLQEGRTAPFPDQQWPNPEVQQVHFAEIQRLFTGETDVSSTLSAMDAAFIAE
jgi:raffinose/stachyose/melibiose transport system substrate-binding protein